VATGSDITEDMLRAEKERAAGLSDDEQRQELLDWADDLGFVVAQCSLTNAELRDAVLARFMVELGIDRPIPEPQKTWMAYVTRADPA
jgi:hypothetical protein